MGKPQDRPYQTRITTRNHTHTCSKDPKRNQKTAGRGETRRPRTEKRPLYKHKDAKPDGNTCTHDARKKRHRRKEPDTTTQENRTARAHGQWMRRETMRERTEELRAPRLAEKTAASESTQTHKHRNTEIQEHRSTEEAQKHKSTKAQKQETTGTQKRKNAEAQRHRHTITGRKKSAAPARDARYWLSQGPANNEHPSPGLRPRGCKSYHSATNPVHAIPARGARY